MVARTVAERDRCCTLLLYATSPVAHDVLLAADLFSLPRESSRYGPLRLRRRVRCAFQVALFATARSHGSTDSSQMRTSRRRRQASRKTTEVRSSAIDQSPVRRKQCVYTASARRSNSCPKASPSWCSAARDHSCWSLKAAQSVVTLSLCPAGAFRFPLSYPAPSRNGGRAPAGLPGGGR